ncbi:MAG: ankyrin repeat domain-containing protein [Alphaproteobacteria bacterium]|nr:MAG: ankyrin repeat domain-containing protein [Alphaproteobacteria bacterium]
MAITRKGRFLNAVRRNDVKKVEKFLDAGFPIEFETWSGNNALLFAVIDGHKEMTEMLIRRGANFARYYGHFALGENGRQDTLLHIAAELGHKDIVLLLLEHDKYDKSLINKIDGRKNTALHLAAAHGRAEIVNILLDHGFDPNIKGESGKTPMGFAHQGRHEVVIGLLADAQKKLAASAPPPPKEAAPRAEWKLVSEHSVAHVSEMPDIGYKLADVFNFETRERIRIVNNLKTKADHIETMAFSELPDRKQLDDARAALVRLGGAADESALHEKAIPRARLAPPEGPR